MDPGTILVEPSNQGVLLVVGSEVPSSELEEVKRQFAKKGVDVKSIKNKSEPVAKALQAYAKNAKGEFDLAKSAKIQNGGVTYTVRNKVRYKKNGPCPKHPEFKLKKCPHGCYEVCKKERISVRSN